MASEFVSIAFTGDSKLFATIGDSGTHINIWDTNSQGLVLKLFTPNTSFKKLKFSENNIELFAITKETKVKVFGIEFTEEKIEAYLLRENHFMHRGAI